MERAAAIAGAGMLTLAMSPYSFVQTVATVRESTAAGSSRKTRCLRPRISKMSLP